MPPLGRTGKTSAEIGRAIGDKFEAALRIPAFERAFNKMATDFDQFARPFQNFRDAIDKATRGFEDQTRRLQELRIQSTSAVLSRQVAMDRALATAQKGYSRAYQIESGRQQGAEIGAAAGSLFGPKGVELGKKLGGAFGEVAARSDWLIRGFRDLTSEALFAAKSLIGIGTVIGIAHQAAAQSGGLSTLQKSWELVIGEIGILFLPAILKASKALQDFAADIRARGLGGALLNLPPGVKAGLGAAAGYRVAGLPGAGIGAAAGFFGRDAHETAVIVGAGGVAVALAKAQSAIAAAGGSLAAYLPTLGPALLAAATAAGSWIWAKRGVEANLQARIAREGREESARLRGLSQEDFYNRFPAARPVELPGGKELEERKRRTLAGAPALPGQVWDPRKGAYVFPGEDSLLGRVGATAAQAATLAGAPGGKGRPGLAHDVRPPGYHAEYQNFADVRRSLQLRSLNATPLEMKFQEQGLRAFEVIMRWMEQNGKQPADLPPR